MPVYVDDKNKNKFIFRCYYTDHTGKRRQKKQRGFNTRKDAKIGEIEFLKTVATTDIIDINIMFESIYYEWLNIKDQQVKPATFYGIKKKCDRHIFPFFKDYKLHSIKTPTILKWKEIMINKKYSIEGINKIIRYLQEILEYAVDNYDFDNKVSAKLFKIRNDAPIKKINDAETNFWTELEYKKFIDCVDSEYYKLLFEFMYYTGCRLGEIRALTWENVDLDNKIIKIYDNLTTKVEQKHKIEGKSYGIFSPKTSNSVRELILDDILIEHLKQHQQQESKLYGFSKEYFVFGNVNHLSETTLRRKLDYYIDLSNTKRITPHGFRHSHASLLINMGCDPYEVADRLGDTVEMILSTYYHMFPHKKNHTIEVINNIRKNQKL